MTEERQHEVPLLEVDHLAVTFYTPRGTFRVVRDVSFTIRRGEVLALVGETGCGKSISAFAIVGYLLPFHPGESRIEGSILFEGRDLTQMTAAELRQIRGDRIAMVYQNPGTSLNPTIRVGAQMEEVLREKYGDLVLQSKINKRVNISESPALKQPITEYDPESQSAQEFKALGKEILRRIRGANNG